MDGRATERQARRLERPAEGAREDLADRQGEAASAAADGARVGPTLRGEVPLRRAVGDDDRVLVGLREVGCGVPEDEDHAATAQRADEVTAGGGGRAATRSR